FEQRVGPAAERGEGLRVAAEIEDVALDADPLVLEGTQEPWPVGTGVARVSERPEGAEVRVEVPRAEGALHLVARRFHLGEGRIGAELGACAGEERLEAEAERLDLLELFEGERRDSRPAAREAHDDALP